MICHSSGRNPPPVIGVVNPLVAAIRERGGAPLLCDFNLRTTQWGDPVTDDMHELLGTADAVVATGMTLSNGSFDTALARCRERTLYRYRAAAGA